MDDKIAVPAGGSQALAWNVENKPTAIGGSTFVYDGDGKRVQKTEGGATVQGACPERSRRINRFYEKNVTTGEVTTYYYLGGRLAALRKGSTVEYVHADHLGGTSVSTDTAGAVKSTVKYFPGACPERSRRGATKSATGALGTDRNFTGQQLDGTGLRMRRST